MKVFHQPDLKRVSFLDERFYTLDGINFLPSVTTILEVYPKGFGFQQWLKDVGGNAEAIVERAAKKGSVVHDATEQLNMGFELSWYDENGNAKYTKEEWEMILRYSDFWTAAAPKLIANEHQMYSAKLGFAGTIDRVVEIDGKVYLIDIKTSNYLHTTYELQLAAYSILWNELNPKMKIEDTAIIWLNASTRTEKFDMKKKVAQGIGWQMKFFDRHYTEAYKIFEHTHAIWKEENPNYKPKNLIYPDRVQIK